jgi:rRNA small subunit pseudouridine methyltransferase Nep1
MSDDTTDDNNDPAHEQMTVPASPSTPLLSSRPMPVVEAAPKSSSSVVNVFDKNKVYPLIVVLDQATLETVKNRKGAYELLSCDDRDMCKKLKKDPTEYRPDILHQEMLALLDSPLNKAGMLKVYVQTKNRVLIDVHPSIRIPRTYKRFAGLMTQLLHKLKVKAGSESTTLLKVIKNPVSQYLPPGTRCYGFSCEGTLYKPTAFVREVLPEQPHGASSSPVCFVVGAMASGHVTIDDHPYLQEMVSISSYPLSGAAALSRLVAAAEDRWGVV